ncbi:conserved Plasmodium protein, unknown function [Plasmodium sp. gorilla clade G3]|nr:conserved Plasmodium protein, unknown function [Plasmodium sp. gorilla clade G3]
MKLFFLFFMFLIKCATSIYDDNFIFTFKNAKKINTIKNDIKKYEIELNLTFNVKKSGKEFFLVSLIPAKNLQILQFKKEETSEINENVEIILNTTQMKDKDSCDYVITAKMYLLKLTKDELKKFKIYHYPFDNKENTKNVPPEYEYSEKSLKTFFPSIPTIYPSTYILKISVEISNEGLNSEGIWIFSIAEKNNSSSEKQKCTIYYDQLAEVFLQKSTSNNLFLLYCNSTTNAEILNLIPDIRKNFDVQLFTTKNFYGAHESIYKVQINFDKIDTTLKADKIMISIKLPVDLCYSNSCFNKNATNPCLNIKSTPFDDCTYIFRSYKFLLKSKSNEVITKIFEVLIENINNPIIDIERDKMWVINVYTIDAINFVINSEHKEILERVSDDVCSKNFINKFINKYSDTITWIASHMAIKPTPPLIFLKVEPIDNHELIENPLIVQLKLLFLEGHIFNNCLIEMKSIHRFTSVLTKTENRLNIYNHKLLLPNSSFKPIIDEEHRIYIEKSVIKNNDIIEFAIDVKKYRNNEYWYVIIKCLNDQNVYVKEAQSLFIYPIENKKIYISDLYYRKKIDDNKYMFYLNIFVYDEKELDIKLSLSSIQENNNIQLSESCDAFVYTSCYNLVYHECSKIKEQEIMYQINSYKSTDKHFTVFFPLIIQKTNENFNLQIELDTKNNPRHVIKKMNINIENILLTNSNKPCINQLIWKLKKYKKKYESHLFILFKVVNCQKIYEPFLVSFQNNENFYAKTDPLDNSEKFTFQKIYKQKYPIDYESISQKIFEKNIISIITIVLIDYNFLYSLKTDGKNQFMQFLKKNVFFSYNKYYVVSYYNKDLLIEFYKYIDVANVRIDIVQKSSDIQNLLGALEKTISFAEQVKHKEQNYMNSEYSILVLTDIKGMINVKEDTNIYIQNDADVDKIFSRIYIIAFEKGDYSNTDIFYESIQKVDHMYIYNYKKKKKDNLYFLSFHKYIIDEQLMLHYSQSILQDYIILHTQIYKTSWYLLGICRNNILKNSMINRKLHIYYVDQLVKTVAYTISKEETNSVYDNSSISSFQDMCNIFTHMQLLGYK